MNYPPARKYSRVAASVIVSLVTLAVLFVVPTSQRHRPMEFGQVAPLAASSSTLGFADSQFFFYNEEQVAQTVQRWVANNIHAVRIGIPWANVETKKGIYDWSRADRVVAAAAGGANISIICAITSSPLWAAAPGSIPPNGRPASPDAYGNFTAAWRRATKARSRRTKYGTSQWNFRVSARTGSERLYRSAESGVPEDKGRRSFGDDTRWRARLG